MLMAAFQQQGKTVMFTANISGSLPTPVATTVVTGVSANQYLVTNIGANTVWIGYDPVSGNATTNAVIPTGGGASAQRAVPVLPQCAITITAPPGCFFTGITASGTSDVHVTPGEGI